jgi:hypothetical protein
MNRLLLSYLVDFLKLGHPEDEQGLSSANKCIVYSRMLEVILISSVFIPVKNLLDWCLTSVSAVYSEDSAYTINLSVHLAYHG